MPSLFAEAVTVRLWIWCIYKKPAILIPTPGQTEQEYLATELMQQKQFFSQTQAEFDMQTALTHYTEFKNFRNFDIETETLKEIISELLKN